MAIIDIELDTSSQGVSHLARAVRFNVVLCREVRGAPTLIKVFPRALAVTSRTIIGQAAARNAVRVVATSPVYFLDQAPPVVIDGVTLAENDRVLLTAELDPTHNGLFTIGPRRTNPLHFGFSSSSDPYDNRRTDDILVEGSVIYATEGLLNRGAWDLHLGTPTWVPAISPVFLSRDSGAGRLFKLVLKTFRVATATIATIPFPRSGPGAPVTSPKLVSVSSAVTAEMFVRVLRLAPP